MSKKISRLHLIAVSILGILSSFGLPVFAQSSFKDIEQHWAKSCILELTNKKIIGGYLEDGTFRPDRPVSRAEFAVMVRRAFPTVKPVRKPLNFIDVPRDYWGFQAIQEAYETGFISSYSGSIFNPEIPITRWQALVSLSNGLNYKSSRMSVENLGELFSDAKEIPEIAQSGIMAATERLLVVNYPDLKLLNPTQPATRSEVASFLCQALLKPGQKSLIPDEYIVKVSGNLAQSRQVIESGKIKAEFSYLPQGGNEGKDFRLKILREGKVYLDETVLIPTRSSAQSNSLEEKGEGRFLSLQITDLDRDGEAEILMDLSSTEGVKSNHSFIYFYDKTQNRYQVVKHSWGNVTYDLVDLERDGNLEFKSYDERLMMLFPNQSNTKLPVRIWRYYQGKMEDVTKLHPITVYTNSSELWLEANQLLQQKQDSKPLFSAYLVTQYLLNKEKEGWQLLQEVYQGNDRDQFFTNLQQFLMDTGYTTSPIYQAKSPPSVPNPTPSISPQPVTPISSNLQVKLDLLRTIRDENNPILSMAITPDNKVLLTGGDREVKLWNLETGEVMTTLSGHQGKIWSMAMSYDGNILATGSGDGTVILWNIKEGKISKTLVHQGWVNRVEFSADSKIVISGTIDKGIKLWSVETGELLTTLDGKNPIAMARLGRLLASSGESNQVKIWDIPQQSLFATLKTLEESGTALRSLAMSRDGLTLVEAISAKSPIRVWDIRTQKNRLQLEGHTDIINGLAIHPNNLILASSSQDKTLKLWDLSTGKILQTVEGFGTIIFSRDGKIMATITQDNTVLLWRLSLTKNTPI